MMGERLFSPKSLKRVVAAVEWEDDVVFYKDGTSNQQRYMQALAILWERWIRGYTLPDFASAVSDIGSENFVEGFVRVIREIPRKVYQLKGFYEGLWLSVNPERPAPAPAAPRATVGSYVSKPEWARAVDSCLSQLRSMLCYNEEVFDE